MGLSIVKHVCANHGGDVTVWSESGRGSPLPLRLPAPAYVPDDQSTTGSIGVLAPGDVRGGEGGPAASTADPASPDHHLDGALASTGPQSSDVTREVRPA